VSGAVVCYLRHRSGLDVPVIKNATAVKDEQGWLWGIIGAITDITELEKARNKVLDAGRRSGEMHGLDKIIGKGGREAEYHPHHGLEVYETMGYSL